MMTRVRLGLSAENEKTVKIPMESDHNNNNDQHFLSICHISGTVLNPLSDLLTESLWQILRDVLFLLASSYIYIYIHIHIYIHTHTHTHTHIYIYMEKAVAPHSSALAWKIPWAKEPGGLQSTGSKRIRHDWATSLSLFTFMPWRRQWQPTPVCLAWRIAGMAEPGGLPSMGSHGVGHDNVKYKGITLRYHTTK